MTPTQRSSAGRILIIDDDAAFREAIVAQLQRAQCETIAAETWEEGLAALRRDPAVNVVILDHPTVSDGVQSVVDMLWAIRPGTTVVGNSGSDRRADFAAAGVTSYLQKPWRLADLFALLLPKTLTCVECGRRLPLRQPKPHEVGRSFVCLTCGARYFALLDETAPPELRPYASPASDG